MSHLTAMSAYKNNLSGNHTHDNHENARGLISLNTKLLNQQNFNYY
jgi:hypothetical protein